MQFINTKLKITKVINVIFRKVPVSSDAFCQASSWMHHFTAVSPNSNRELKFFVTCAENYMLSGRLNEVCDHNSTVASNAGRNDVSKNFLIIHFLI